VLNACAESGVRKVVAPSTTMAYGALRSNPNYLAEADALRAGGFRMLADRVEIERQLARHAGKHPDRIVTVLRPALTLGPRVRNVATRYFAQPFVYTFMGHDPLMQFVHEEDVLRALKLVVDEDHPGVYNIVGQGVLPLSTLLKLAGKVHIPVPSPLLRAATDAMWLAQVGIAPAAYLSYIRWLFVADGTRAADRLGFKARYSTKEALLDFVGMRRLQHFRLADEGSGRNAPNRVYQRKRRVL